MKRLFSKPTTWMVLALLTFFLYAIESRAETHLEIAPATVFVGGEYVQGQGALRLSERWQDKYEIGMVLLIDVNDREQGNTGFELMRVSEWRGIEVGMGYTFWSDQSIAWDAERTFALMLGKRINDKWTIRLRHWSTGGTSPLNSGLDMLMIGRKFGAR